MSIYRFSVYNLWITKPTYAHIDKIEFIIYDCEIFCLHNILDVKTI